MTSLRSPRSSAWPLLLRFGKVLAMMPHYPLQTLLN